MLSAAQNEYVTRTNDGTPMGALLRRFWLPALMSAELPEADCAPLRIRLLGEDLVVFRDTNGQVGLLAANCPHRGASLFFGRNEESGIRCVYHGWKFDVLGQCVDMPSEPAESDFRTKVKAVAYPTREAGGIVWAYMGPPQLMGELPALEWTLVPSNQRFISKRHQQSNYLQAIEGGIDSSHVSFLHSTIQFEDSRLSSLGQVIGRVPKFLAEDKQPRFELLETAYGHLVAARRDAGPDDYYWRVSQYLLPVHQMIPAAKGAPISGHAWVPIDDENCWAWTMTWQPDQALTEEEIASYRSGEGIHAAVDANYRTLANKDNDYLIDRAMQRTATFTGIRGIGEQDMACQESMGPIYDRTKEHVGSSDTAIIAMRRQLLRLAQQLEQGHEPAMVYQPDAYRVRSASFVIPRSTSWLETTAAAMPAPLTLTG
jgi:phenylpropionate dioxygenase-like ring-hydroxylating dioxygenase large terminal subunit